MSLSLTIFTFINAWWIMLFFVLPFHITVADQSDPLAYAAAPQSVRWKRAFKVNTALALGVTVVLWLMVRFEVIPLHDLLG